jgi:hypothetical protein
VITASKPPIKIIKQQANKKSLPTPGGFFYTANRKKKAMRHKGNEATRQRVNTEYSLNP